jgi:hypothetical protein
VDRTPVLLAYTDTPPVVAALEIPMTEDRCPACGLLVRTVPDFQAHHRAIADDEPHIAALYTLLGIDYAALVAEARAARLRRAHERGWRLL